MKRPGKLEYSQVMGRAPFVRSSLPETKMFTRESFDQMINRYGTVIVKPNWGSGGAGVVKVSRQSNGKYVIHYGANRQVFPHKTAALFFLRQYISHRTYIVQRCISMCKVNGRPFDLRVMIQRKRESLGPLQVNLPKLPDLIVSLRMWQEVRVCFFRH